MFTCSKLPSALELTAPAPATRGVFPWCFPASFSQMQFVQLVKTILHTSNIWYSETSVTLWCSDSHWLWFFNILSSMFDDYSSIFDSLWFSGGHDSFSFFIPLLPVEISLPQASKQLAEETGYRADFECLGRLNGAAAKGGGSVCSFSYVCDQYTYIYIYLNIYR